MKNEKVNWYLPLLVWPHAALVDSRLIIGRLLERFYSALEYNNKANAEEAVEGKKFKRESDAIENV